MPGIIRGTPPAQTGNGGPHIHFVPVPGQVVFFTALLLIVLVIAGWRLIAEKCRKCDE